MQSPDSEQTDRVHAPPMKRTTGRLTRRQAEALNSWRRRLLEDRPLPGQRRLDPDVSRSMGLAEPNRPLASTSDLLAAAVEDLLANPPTPRDLAAYAERSASALAAARRVRPDRASPKLPVYPPVTLYLPPELASRVLALCAAAAEAGGGGDTSSSPAVRIPDVVRMAIDRWIERRFSPDRAASLAVAFAARNHTQPHRTHRDSAIW
jgi:hypothetical protein